MFSIRTSDPNNLFCMARSKLQSVVGAGAKDNCSLHRWVLLKNSIIHSHPATTPVVSTDNAISNDVYKCDGQEEDEDAYVEEEDMFVFPDVGVLVDSRDTDAAPSSEAQWLDSLLETLGDEGEEVAMSPADDDDEPFSPSISPMSSSDDLCSQCVQSSLFYPPTPYPPYQSPLTRPFNFDANLRSPLDTCHLTYDDPLPYADDVDDLSVPDAIEDTSDDESDSPVTPFARSTSSLIDPASIPLPMERTRPGRHPRVYVDTDDSYFYPFELDPPPFTDDHVHSHAFSVVQEC